MYSSFKFKASVIAVVFFYVAGAVQAQKKASNEVRSRLGGLPFVTEGSLPDGTCFRISGRATNPEFFTTLVSTEEKDKVIFRRDSKVVTQFPALLSVVYVIRDQPCSYEFRPPPRGSHLTQETMDGIRVSLYWKQGMKLRPAEQASETVSSVEPILPYAKNLADVLPKRFEWTFHVDVKSRGIPLADSLVLVFRLSNGWTAARVSARL
jgi:hypothetical protein